MVGLITSAQENRLMKHIVNLRSMVGCVLVSAVVALAGTALAQSIVTGALTGVVTDPTGAIVPNTKVTLTSTETGEAISQTTGATGAFTFPLLKPGSYKLGLSLQGFQHR
jgi:hypothetical protein